MRKFKKPNITLERITILEMAAEGKCIAKHEDKVIFVEKVAPGDVVDLKITRSKKSFSFGEAIHFHEFSKLRSEVFCSHFGVCGGCKWQHLDYNTQLLYKQKQVKDSFERIGKIPIPTLQPILGAPKQQYYRNKLEYTFSNNRWLTRAEIDEEQDIERNALGFHIPEKFDKIVDIQHCYLQPDPSNAIRLAVRDYAIKNKLTFYDIRQQVGLLRILIIRTSITTGEIMVIIQFGEDNKEAIADVMNFVSNEFPQLSSLQYVINKKGNDTFHDLEVHCFKGKPYIVEKMEDLEFRIGAKSFYQTNSTQAYELYKITRDFAKLTGEEVVYDLYTGTGTIANFVAKQCKKVIGIEYVAPAIEDAKVNAQINNIAHADFYAGDMKDVLNDAFIATHGKPDVIITDPPRAGMHEDVIKMLLKIKPTRIVYVSCNPATQARDVALLDELYGVEAIAPVDMFPHTHHVENVCALVLRS
jgi:23S rRNA (uracil1939-C5)-methyltransferase